MKLKLSNWEQARQNLPNWKWRQFYIEFAIGSPLWICFIWFVIIWKAITDYNEFLLADSENLVNTIINENFYFAFLQTRHIATILSLFICAILFKTSIILFILYAALLYWLRLRL